MFYIFGTFWNYFKFDEESRAYEETPCGRSLGVTTGRLKSAAVERTAGDTTDRRRFGDSASV